MLHPNRCHYPLKDYLSSMKKHSMIFDIKYWLSMTRNKVYLPWQKNSKKVYNAFFCDQWSIGTIVKNFYQIPLTRWKIYLKICFTKKFEPKIKIQKLHTNCIWFCQLNGIMSFWYGVIQQLRGQIFDIFDPFLPHFVHVVFELPLNVCV